MEREPLGKKDRITAEKQLGRVLRGDAQVAARCPYGVVEVIATPPVLPDGTPFPTLYWLSCPLLQRSVSGLENGEFRTSLRHRLEEEPVFAQALQEAETEYVAAREEWAGEMQAVEQTRGYFSGREGIGGTVAGGLKCLHAHLAHYLAVGKNPIGEVVMTELEGLQESECTGDCGPFTREGARR